MWWDHGTTALSDSSPTANRSRPGGHHVPRDPLLPMPSADRTDRAATGTAVILSMDGPVLALSEYTDAIEAGWTEHELLRAILHDLPRRFHALTPAEQEGVLNRAPALTHTRWDALLAATVEHIAMLHGHALPQWIDEPARFLAETWVVTDVHCIRMDAIDSTDEGRTTSTPGARGSRITTRDVDCRRIRGPDTSALWLGCVRRA